jgi:hypothetical protein
MSRSPGKPTTEDVLFELVSRTFICIVRFGVIGFGLGLLATCLVPRVVDSFLVASVLGTLIGVSAGAAGGVVDSWVRLWKTVVVWPAGVVIISACAWVLWLVFQFMYPHGFAAD